MLNNDKQDKALALSERPWYQRSVAEIFSDLQSSPAGLSAATAQERLQKQGPNALPQKAEKSALLKFIAHFKDVLIYILLAAAVITAIMGHWVDTFVIIGVAVINALIGFIQENNAEKSLKSIQNMLASEAMLVRDGKQVTVATRDIVVGDVVMLRPAIKSRLTFGCLKSITCGLKRRSSPESRRWCRKTPIR